MFRKLSTAICTLLFVPLVASAQSLQTLIVGTLDFFNKVLVPLIFALAFLFFIWNAFQYFILKGATPEGQEKAKRFMLWSIIAFVIMVSIWGIVNLFANTLGLTQPNSVCPDYNPTCNLPFTPGPDCNPTNPSFPNC